MEMAGAVVGCEVEMQVVWYVEGVPGADGA